MAVDAVYLLDEKKQIRRVIAWGVYELIHDEATYELDAEIASEYDARPGEFLAFFDVDAHLRLFEIDSAEKDERRGVTVIVATDAAVAELARLVAQEIRLTAATAQEAAQAALAGSGWQLGEMTAQGTGHISAYMEKRWKVLRDIAVQYQARVTPYFVIENGEITGRRVDVTPRENIFRGRLFEGTSGGAQIYVTRSGAPITRMYGVGKAIGTEDPPTCVTFADIAWSKAAGDPADKPQGQSYIEDPDAAALYGEDREDVFADKFIEDPEQLLEKTWAHLQKRKAPKVTGTATASDMEHIPGYEHMIVRMHDLVWVRTKTGEDVSAAVINVKRNYLRRGLTKITIGEEADDSGLIAKIAKLASTSGELQKSRDSEKNRFLLTRQLIQLNADTIQMNARLIEANAEQIRLTASNLTEYEEGTDERLTTAELTLYGDGTSANAGLAASVAQNTNDINRIDEAVLELQAGAGESVVALAARVGRLEEQSESQSEALLSLQADMESANASLSARVGSNEASILLHADEIGTLAEIKADKVDLGKYATVQELEAERAEIEANINRVVTTDVLNVLNNANFTSQSISVGGTPLKLMTKSLLNGNTSLTVNASGGVVTGVTLNRKYTEFHYLGYE